MVVVAAVSREGRRGHHARGGLETLQEKELAFQKLSASVLWVQ